MNKVPNRLDEPYKLVESALYLPGWLFKRIRNYCSVKPEVTQSDNTNLR